MAGSDDVGTAKNEAELSYNDPNVTLPTLDSPSRLDSESWPRAGNPGRDLCKTDCTETSILAPWIVRYSTDIGK